MEKKSIHRTINSSLSCRSNTEKLSTLPSLSLSLLFSSGSGYSTSLVPALLSVKNLSLLFLALPKLVR
jgi:hypothetical protein